MGMIAIISAVDFPFFDNQFASVVHIPHGADDGFHTQAGHVGDLLAGKFELVALGAEILVL